MSPAQRRFLLVEQGVGSAVFNFGVNALIAWLMFRGHERVPLWGQQSIVGDTIGTSAILPFLTCLIATPLVLGNVRRGRVDALPWTRASHPVLGCLPAGRVWRALALGVVGAVVFAPVTVLLLDRLVESNMAFRRFILFKASFAALESFFVTPVVSIYAMSTRDLDSGRERMGRVPPGEQSQRRAAAGKAGAADFPDTSA